MCVSVYCFYCYTDFLIHVYCFSLLLSALRFRLLPSCICLIPLSQLPMPCSRSHSLTSSFLCLVCSYLPLLLSFFCSLPVSCTVLNDLSSFYVCCLFTSLSALCLCFCCLLYFSYFYFASAFCQVLLLITVFLSTCVGYIFSLLSAVCVASTVSLLR